MVNHIITASICDLCLHGNSLKIFKIFVKASKTKGTDFIFDWAKIFFYVIIIYSINKD